MANMPTEMTIHRIKAACAGITNNSGKTFRGKSAPVPPAKAEPHRKLRCSTRRWLHPATRNYSCTVRLFDNGRWARVGMVPDRGINRFSDDQRAGVVGVDKIREAGSVGLGYAVHVDDRGVEFRG